MLDDHLRQSQDGSLEVDLERNYAGEVVLLAGGRGIHHGHAGLRRLTELLQGELPNYRFTYTTRQVVGELAFLEWRAEADGARVDDGADSYLIRDGRILAQTIHYTVKET